MLILSYEHQNQESKQNFARSKRRSQGYKPHYFRTPPLPSKRTARHALPTFPFVSSTPPSITSKTKPPPHERVYKAGLERP
jgi:hypothetical protein